MSEEVLVPGLWMPAAVMALIAPRERPVHLVGHSLGGVLIFDLLQNHREIAARRVVLLGALPGENDSVACVEESRVEGMAERAGHFA